MLPYTKTDEMLLLYRKFRKLWVLQGDMMHPYDVKWAYEELVKMSDRLAEMEDNGLTRRPWIFCPTCGKKTESPGIHQCEAQ